MKSLRPKPKQDERNGGLGRGRVLGMKTQEMDWWSLKGKAHGEIDSYRCGS